MWYDVIGLLNVFYSSFIKIKDWFKNIIVKIVFFY